VLSAFGSSVSDISHVHEEWPFLDLSEDADEPVWELVEAGRRRVLRDLEGEGLSTADANLSVEVTVTGGGQTRNWTVEMQQEKLQDALSEARSANGGVVERVAVRGVSSVPRVDLEASAEQRYEAEPPDQRTVLGEQAGLYDWNDLTPGAVITGPAVLESETNTGTIPADWELQVDGFGNAVLRRARGDE
jgi:N-methylhydantoinase A